MDPVLVESEMRDDVAPELHAETKTPLEPVEPEEPSLQELRRRFEENAKRLDLEVAALIRQELKRLKSNAGWEQDLVFDKDIVYRWLELNGHGSHMDKIKVSQILRAEMFKRGLKARNIFDGIQTRMQLLSVEEEAEN